MTEPVRAEASPTALDDGVLVELYRTERDPEAMRALVERHHGAVHRYLRRELRGDADLEAWFQTLWIRVARRLDDYRDEDDFPRWLASVATDLLEECGRGTETRGPGAGRGGAGEGERTTRPVGAHAARGAPADDRRIDRLVRELIPALPVEQRTAWLLRHETGPREPGRRLEWEHLAELNGVGVADAWALFESARGRLIGGARSPASTVLDEEEMLVFLVWTQAQRAVGAEDFSWEHVGELLGVPAATMRARYRAARRRLSDALEGRQPA